MTRKQALATVRRAVARRLRALKANDRKGAASALRVARKYRQIARALRVIRRVSTNGVNLVAEFEGFRSCPYKDPVGIWTIGYGETRGVTSKTGCWSKRKARRRLRQRLNEDFLPAVKVAERDSGKRLNQNQIDALTSFVYNVGPGALSNETKIGRAVRSGNFGAVPDLLMEWNKAGGQVLPGLTRRRAREADLFRKAA